MKKNISVNIFGTLYPIDEDAYELLQKYNENMRRYYSRREDGDEIADDVEHRVAELLSELRASGVMAITIEHVKEIITRIGDPQEMDDAETSGPDDVRGPHEATGTGSAHADGGSSRTEGGRREFSGTYTGSESSRRADSEPQDEGYSTRKLFRDPEDKLLGGVLSGVSHYFGIKDPIVLRLFMIILLIISFTTFAIPYIIAWILIPEAVTPEDRLRMYGKPVSAKAINEELMRGVNNATQFVNNPQHRDTARGCLSAFFKFVLFCCAALVIFILGSIFLSLIAAIAGVSIATIFGAADTFYFDGQAFTIDTITQTVPTWLIITATASCLCIVGLPLFGLIRAITRRNTPATVVSNTTNVALVVAWVICVGIFIGSAVRIASACHGKFVSYEQDKHTQHGIYLKGSGWNILNRQGWKVAKLSGMQPYIYEWGIMPDGDEAEFISIKAKDNPNDLAYNLRQQKHLHAGDYKIYADVRADGEGNALFVVTKQGKDTIRVDIPKYEKKQNDISDEEVIADSNDGKSLWQHVEGTFHLDKDQEVDFGITNDSRLSVSPWNGRGIDIANVSISRR